jgi:hypothetical protein
MKYLLPCLLLAGCQALAQPPLAALLVEPSAEINQQIAKLLGIADVKLAQDAFMHEDELLIEPAKLPGLSLARPERFSLSISGTRCWLSNSRERVELKTAKCRVK